MRSAAIVNMWCCLREVVRAGVAVAVVVASAGTASAGGPLREFTGLVPGDNFDLPVCEGFDVNVLIVQNGEYTLTFDPDAAGTTRQLVDGRFVVTFTNVSTGTAVTRNVSGPGEYRYLADGSVDFSGSGPWAIFFFQDQRGDGTPPALFINYGLIELHTDPGGVQSIVNQVGTQEDLCATLAP
jgi:hypothetical protein